MATSSELNSFTFTLGSPTTILTIDSDGNYFLPIEDEKEAIEKLLKQDGGRVYLPLLKIAYRNKRLLNENIELKEENKKLDDEIGICKNKINRYKQTVLAILKEGE